MKRVLRRVKQGFKKAISQWSKKTHVQIAAIDKPARADSVPSKQKQKEKATVKKKPPIEVTVGGSKFYTPPSVEKEKEVYPEHRELPAGYAQDRIVLQVRDPWWIHAYWEITESTKERLRREFPAEFTHGLKKVLRVYDISHIVFTGDNAHRFFDIDIADEANNWYIDTQGSGRSWCVDLGIRLSDGRFITILRSNTVSTPLSGPSWITDEEWMIPEDLFSRLYGMGLGLGSSPINLKKIWQERLKGEFGSGALFSAASPVKKAKPQGFWLSVNTELIVYGQTQPGAKLTVGGRPVSLRTDGSFSLRFFLPDGKQVIPVTATSSDGEQTRSITPVVIKETK